MQIAFTLYLIVLFPGGAPRRDECRDMAERERVQGRSGGRIRAPKQSGAVSFILLPVRAKVRFRVTMTSPRPRMSSNRISDPCAPTPMKTAWGWSAKLTRTIVLKDGTRLATLADVRALILNKPNHIQERGSWQHAELWAVSNMVLHRSGSRSKAARAD